MRYLRIHAVVLVVLLLLALFAFSPTDSKIITVAVPKGWPQPAYEFSKFPLTEDGFQLGRKLFYDPILSRDGTVSCASCHNQSTGFTHVDHAHSHGIEGRKGTRNTPALMNLVWNKSFMWDGAINHIEVQALAPITNPIEMDETLEHVVKKLNASAVYRRQFDKAFGDSVITGQHLLLAITQFVIQLNSSNSKYDQYIRKEAGGKFTAEEEHGLQLFRQNCAACHTEPLFTNGLFENNGLPLDDSIKDLGRMKISQRQEDSLKFKVPTLRNIQYSAPYMHDGRFSRLSQVVNHYTGGIVRSRTLSEKLNKPVQLTEPEKKDLISFLMTLTDREFLLNLRFSFPKENK